MKDQLIALLVRVKSYDDRMCGVGEFEGLDPQPPDGDNYNELYSDVVGTLKDLLK